MVLKLMLSSFPNDFLSFCAHNTESFVHFFCDTLVVTDCLILKIIFSNLKSVKNVCCEKFSLQRKKTIIVAHVLAGRHDLIYENQIICGRRDCTKVCVLESLAKLLLFLKDTHIRPTCSFATEQSHSLTLRSFFCFNKSSSTSAAFPYDGFCE